MDLEQNQLLIVGVAVVVLVVALGGYFLLTNQESTTENGVPSFSTQGGVTVIEMNASGGYRVEVNGEERVNKNLEEGDTVEVDTEPGDSVTVYRDGEEVTEYTVPEESGEEQTEEGTGEEGTGEESGTEEGTGEESGTEEGTGEEQTEETTEEEQTEERTLLEEVRTERYGPREDKIIFNGRERWTVITAEENVDVQMSTSSGIDKASFDNDVFSLDYEKASWETSDSPQVELTLSKGGVTETYTYQFDIWYDLEVEVDTVLTQEDRVQEDRNYRFEVVINSGNENYTVDWSGSSLEPTLSDDNMVATFEFNEPGEERVVVSVVDERSGEAFKKQYNITVEERSSDGGSDETTTSFAETGNVTVNPPISGATVKALKDGSVVETTTTDSNGFYGLTTSDFDQLRVDINGFTDPSLSNPLYAEYVLNTNSGADFNFTNPVNVSVNGTQVLVSSEINSTSELQVNSVQQLRRINATNNRTFEVRSDIDAVQTENWNGGKGFKPLYNDTRTFNGALNGNGHTIKNLHIDRPSTNGVGLFEDVSGDVNNLRLRSIFVNGSNGVGSLASTTRGLAKIDNVTVDGNSPVEGDFVVGGIVGSVSKDAIVNDSSYDPGNTTTLTGQGVVGGIAGQAAGTISNSTGGGFVEVNGNKGGGVVGKVTRNGSVNNVETDFVSVIGDFRIGGIAGVNEGEIRSSTSRASVSGSEDFVGGVVGLQNEGSLSDVNALEPVDGRNSVGGAVGRAVGTAVMSDLRVGANVTGGVSVGGVVGSMIGGAFLNESEVQRGVFGKNIVKGKRDVGGLVGNADGSAGRVVIRKSFVQAQEVEATGNRVGGVVGFNNQATFNNTYAVSSVIGSDSGGLAAENNGTIVESYWDEQTTGQSSGAAIGNVSATGLNTSQMQGSAAKTNMTDFRFPEDWNTVPNDYPLLNR